jgi:DMSO/TMAO reductase YedYZ molybdopterin-dependent catalytic subunit
MNMSKKISRRTFLHRAVLSSAATLLTACAPNQQKPAENLPSETLSTAALKSTAKEDGLAASPSVTLSADTGSTAIGCNLARLIAPTRPPKTPAYTELDATTGLHMTGTVQEIDLTTYRLEVAGLVDHPLNLTLDELRCMPVVTTSEDLFCPGFFDDEATWAGVPIKHVLDLAGVQSSAKGVNLISGDSYTSYPTLTNAMDEKNFLAYAWNDKPLPVLHGFPLRGIFPGMAGSMWTKWLVKLLVE